MYSQYSYYQNNSPATPSRQPVQATITADQVWNGQQWIATATATAPSSYAQAVAAAPTPAIIKHGKTHSELVQHYTDYYHRWQAQTVSSKATLTALPPPHPNTPGNNARREEMERREKWASYYSSNSAALAHYHLALSKSRVEPYARPASPPAPPQVTAAKAGSAIVAAAPASPATTVSSTTEVGKKKSRWAPVKEEGQEEKNYGKSSSAAAGSASTVTSLAATVADDKKKENASSNNNQHLYLNKFVQEKSSLEKLEEKSSLEKLEESTLVSRKNNNLIANRANSTQQPSASATSAKGKVGGKKRKLTDRRSSSSLSASDSYYGPQPTQVHKKTTSSVSPRKEERDAPLALNQALGTAKKGKKPKKKEAKKSVTVNMGPSGFDANQTVLSERACRFKGKGGIHDAASSLSSVHSFDKYMGKSTIGGSKKHLDDNDYERMTVKGTCQTLEKNYFRLTSPPNALLVRPQPILEQHLSNLKHSYYHCGKVHDGRSRDYDWYCSQFKALRQDLTVQRLINRFSVDVYETHAKVALEEDDINEYNQSQTQLKELYDSIDGGGGGGKHLRKIQKKEREEALKNQNEFIAYRIIYYVFLSGNRKYEGGSSDIFKIMLQLSPEQRKDECIHHALLVRASVAENDYHKFFQLQDTAPNMSDYLMDKIVPSVRRDALQRICRAYRPSVSALFVLKELGFHVHNKEEVEGAKAWMESCGCVFVGGTLMTKDTVLKESSAVGLKSSLI